MQIWNTDLREIHSLGIPIVNNWCGVEPKRAQVSSQKNIGMSTQTCVILLCEGRLLVFPTALAEDVLVTKNLVCAVFLSGKFFLPGDWCDPGRNAKSG